MGGWNVKEILCGLLRFILHSATKLFVSKLNRLKVYNRETYVETVMNRGANKPLITFCNHYSCMDEPFIWAVSSWRVVLWCSWTMFRWTPAAKEICFTSPMKNRFFTWNRGIPIIRGNGVYQSAMNDCIDKLNNGGWIHIFPEGKVNEEHLQLRLKWGIGRLVAESNTVPIVLPMFHIGFDKMFPNSKPYRLKTGNDVTIAVGEPIDYTDMLDKLKSQNLSTEEIRKAITDDIQEKFRQLRQRTEHLHNLRVNK